MTYFIHPDGRVREKRAGMTYVEYDSTSPHPILYSAADMTGWTPVAADHPNVQACVTKQCDQLVRQSRLSETTALCQELEKLQGMRLDSISVENGAIELYDDRDGQKFELYPVPGGGWRCREVRQL